MLRKIYVLLVFFLFISFFHHSSLEAGNVMKKKVSLSVMPNIKPVAFRNDKGEADGIFVRVLQEIAKVHDFEIEYHFLPWSEGLEAVKKGEIDLLGGAIKTEERETFLDYDDESVMTGWGHVRIHEDSKISKIFDLDGKKIAVMVSDQNYKNFKKYADSFKIKCDYVEVSTHKAIVEMIASKEVDAGVLFNMTQVPVENVKNSPIVFSPVKSYFVTAKGTNAELMKIITEQLKVWKKDKSSPYYAIISRFIGGTYRKEFFTKKIKILAGVILAILFFLMIIIFFLKYMVNRKTKDLKESEQHLRTIVENMPIMMDALDAEANVIMWNKECERVTGYSADEVIGNEKIYELLYQDPIYRKNLIKSLQSGMEDFKFQEFPIIAKDGKKRIISWSSISNECPIPGWCFWAVGIDVTKLVESKKELIAAKEKAETSDKLKSAFVSSISHEIRTPMNGLLGFSNLLQDIDVKSAEREEYIKIIKKSGKKMLTIINDLIDVSMIEANKVELYLKPISANTLIDEVCKSFKEEADIKNISLETVKPLDYSQSILILDKNCILKVITHLVANALKFTDKGKVVIGYKVKEKFLEFFVQDTGIGIDSETKGVIFERFRQLYDSYSKKYEGSGIGLYVSKAYVEMHGGTIWFESEVGSGTCFYFTIPYK